MKKFLMLFMTLACIGVIAGCGSNENAPAPVNEN